MAQLTTDELERETPADPVVATPLRPAPAEAAPTLSSYAQAEAYQGVLERASLHQTPGLYTRAWHVFRANKVALVALCVLILVVIFVLSAGIISAHVTGFTPEENHLRDKLTPPMTGGYILGSDGNGRDVLTRLAYGGRVSLRIAALSAFGIFFLGGVIGVIAGYVGGTTDAIVMRVVDVGLSIPGLPLLILISSLFSPGPEGLALVLAFVSWPGIARLIRGETLGLKQRDYVGAAYSLGASPARIVLRHILPNLVPLLVVYTSLSLPGLMLAETGLSFLGIGVQVPTPSWGNMLGDGQQFFRTNISLVFIPGLMIYITSLSMYLVGSGLRDAFDPKLTQ